MLNKFMALLDAGIEDETNVILHDSTEGLRGGMIRFARVSYHLLISHIFPLPFLKIFNFSHFR